MFQVAETAAYRDAMKYSQREIAEQVPSEVQKAEFEFISQALEKNIKEAPLLFSSYLALGKVYNLYGRIDPSKFERAEQVLEKAVEISPGNQQAYWVLAQTKLFQGKFEEAILLAEKAVDLEPRVERSNIILIQIAAIVRDMTGNNDLLIKEINRVLQFNPAWATDVQMVLEQQVQ
jgi:tetratricopeptide (TPR) repeat protein